MPRASSWVLPVSYTHLDVYKRQRLYRFRGTNTLFRSVDHSYVEHLVSIGRITPEEALVHPNRNVLITSLGGKDAPKFSFGEADDLSDGDIFMLCSDGLWPHFEEAEMARILSLIHI